MEDILLEYAGFDAIDTISADWCAIWTLCRGATA